jgi:hypothetical protein
MRERDVERRLKDFSSYLFVLENKETTVSTRSVDWWNSQFRIRSKIQLE